MTQVTIEEAVTQLPHLIEKAKRGEDIVLTQNSQPAARLVSLVNTRAPRKPGSAKGIILHIADDFDVTPEGFEEYLP